jgi:hypothetical protein
MDEAERQAKKFLNEILYRTKEVGEDVVLDENSIMGIAATFGCLKEGNDGKLYSWPAMKPYPSNDAYPIENRASVETWHEIFLFYTTPGYENIIVPSASPGEDGYEETQA